MQDDPTQQQEADGGVRPEHRHLLPLASVLARLVRDSGMPKAAAVKTLRGVITTGATPSDLPLNPGDHMHGILPATITAAAAALAARAGTQWIGQIAPMDGRSGLLAQYREVVHSDFITTARTMADDLAGGRMSIAEWQAAFSEQVSANLVMQSMLGLGAAELPPDVLIYLSADALRQQGYVSRFADQMAAAKAADAPYSAARIGSRSELYGGQGRGEWFRSAERSYASEYGMVCFYVAHDDATTCGLCADNALGSPYLPADGPYPGIDCLGRSRCRCYREIVYDEQAYQQALAGGQRGAGSGE